MRCDRLAAVCLVLILTAAGLSAADAPASTASAETTSDILKSIQKGVGPLSTVETRVGGVRAFCVWHNPYSGRDSCHVHVYRYSPADQKWERVLAKIFDRTHDVSIEVLSGRLQIRDVNDRVVWKKSWETFGAAVRDQKAADKPQSEPNNPLPLKGTQWTMTHFTQHDGVAVTATAVLKRAPVTLRIDGDRAGGSGGGNRYECDVQVLAGGKLKISKFAATEFMVVGKKGRQERQFFGLFPDMTRYKIRDKILYLSDDDGFFGLKFEGVEADE